MELNGPLLNDFLTNSLTYIYCIMHFPYKIHKHTQIKAVKPDISRKV